MKLSAQDEYGLRCLLRLARQADGQSLTIPEISQAEGISHHNVAKYLSILRKRGFVDSERGQRGGYSLARRPEEVVVGEVLAALGGPLFDPSFCQHHTGVEDECQHSSVDCTIRALWSRVQAAIDGVLRQTTLQDMLSEVRALEARRQAEAAPAALAEGDLLQVLSQ
ncbi:RrF2 family transcriptional regulator [Candidatus Latescibacterota bacterium]